MMTYHSARRHGALLLALLLFITMMPTNAMAGTVSLFGDPVTAAGFVPDPGWDGLPDSLGQNYTEVSFTSSNSKTLTVGVFQKDGTWYLLLSRTVSDGSADSHNIEEIVLTYGGTSHSITGVPPYTDWNQKGSKAYYALAIGADVPYQIQVFIDTGSPGHNTTGTLTLGAPGSIVVRHVLVTPGGNYTYQLQTFTSQSTGDTHATVNQIDPVSYSGATYLYSSSDPSITLPYQAPYAGPTMSFTLYYTQIKYTVTYNKGANGNLAGQDGSGNVVFANLPSGSTTPTAPVVTANAGYTFTGWNPVPSATVTGDATYIAQYTANTNTPYTIKYYLQNLALNGYDYQAGQDKTKTGTTGTTGTVADPADIKSFTGFTYDAGNANNVLSGTIAGDGSLVLKVYYSRNKYTVTYNKGANGNLAGQDGSGNVIFANQVFGASTPTAPVVTANVGYTFTGWNPVPSATVTGDATYIAQYTANTNTPYTIKYYLQNLALSGYDYQAGQDKTKTGTTGTTGMVADPADIRSFTGFTYDAGNVNNVLSGTIAGDGSLVLKVYYSRNKYTVTYNKGANGNLAGQDGSGNVVFLNQVYGAATPTAPMATANVGYTFTGWSPLPSATVTGDAMYVAQYQINVHTVTYMIDSTVYDTEPNIPYGTPKTVQGAPDAGSVPTGFTFAGWNTFDVSVTGGNYTMPDNDVTFVANLTRNIYTVTYLVDGVQDGDLEGYFYGDDVTVRLEPTKTGFTFSGWQYPGSISVSGGMFDMPAQNVQITGIFTPITYTLQYKYVDEFGNLIPADQLPGDISPAQDGTETYTLVNKATVDALPPLTDWMVFGWYRNPQFIGGIVVPGSEFAETPSGLTTILYAKLIRVRASLDVDKFVTSITPSGGYKLGDTINYSVTVTNTGNQTLTNIMVHDLLMGPDQIIPILLPGQTIPFIYSHTVTEQDILNGNGKLTNVFTASTTFRDEPVSDTDDETTAIEDLNPSLDVVKTITSTTPDSGYYSLGDVIDYSVTVTNNGNQTLTYITVHDPLMGPDDTIASLAPGASKTFTYSHTVTEADILNGNGKLTNVFTASTTFGDEPVSDSDTKTTDIEALNPSLDVVKTITSQPLNPNGYVLGEEIDYRVTVTNNGNQTLTNIKVSDPLMGADQTIASLAPKASQKFDYSYTVTEADILTGNGLLTNVFTASTIFGDKPVSDSDTKTTDIEDLNPALDVVKSITNQPSNPNGYVLGEAINYSVTVTNTGNQTLTNIKVSDPLMGADQTIASLAPKASQKFDYSYTVTEADILTGNGLLTNVFTASTTFGDEPVSDTDDETTDIEDLNPALDVVKTITNQPSNPNGYVLGEAINYSVTVTNNGNQTLTNIKVSDPRMGADQTIASLVPKASQKFDYSYTVTEADILTGNGLLTNVFTASTTFGDEPVSDTDDETTDIEDLNPALDVVKTITNQPANPNGYVLGEAINYSVTVTNNGNQTLTNITVQDLLMGPDDTIASLAPGESKTITYSHTVTEADILTGNGLLTNVFTASTTFGDERVSDSDTKTTDIEDLNPSLSVLKAVTSATPAGGYGLGHVIQYTVTVTNNGNQTLTNITVNDPMMGLDDLIIASLAPGESYPAIVYTHTVTAADVTAGTVINVVTVKAGDKIEERSTTTTPIDNAIDVTGTVEWFYGPAMSPDSPKPTEVQVQLYANGTPYGPAVTVTGIGTTWTHTWPGLLKTDAEGNPIVYSIVQLDVLTGYNTANTDNLTVLNALQYFIVLFSDFDGTVLKTIGVSYGGSTTPPAGPDNRVGFTFDRWTGGVWENVTADQLIIAVYNPLPGLTDEGITELGIPLAGGTVANVGDTFD